MDHKRTDGGILTVSARLFAPTTSTDRQDDESLSMRIAGLHMLDLTLDHLGIQTDLVTGDPEADDVQRTIRDGLEEIVSLCGKGRSPHIGFQYGCADKMVL